MRFISKNEKQTIRFAQQFAKELRGGEVLLLCGDLGSGKTTFVKGLAQAFKIKSRVTSPTFVLMHQYKIRNPQSAIHNFVHTDAYRLKIVHNLLDIGLADWLGRQDTIIAIEWGEKLAAILKKQKIVKIFFEHGQNKDERIIKMR